MPAKENTISYQTTNTYTVLNTLKSSTQNIWVACHGIGYLSKYFIGYFEHLNKDKNYIICPQAPSKYYQDKQFKYVGASWLTKENTQQEIENVLNYLDALFAKEEKSFQNKRLILMGYSQGVSVVLRWLAYRNIVCDDLVIHSGRIPSELSPVHFKKLINTKVHLVYGDEDEYLNNQILDAQIDFAKSLFPNQPQVHQFKGKHEVSIDFLSSIAY